MNIVGCHGDSGGPLFSEVDNKAYGIVSEGRGTPYTDGNGLSCYPATVYAALSVIFAKVTGFAVNTA